MQQSNFMRISPLTSFYTLAVAALVLVSPKATAQEAPKAEDLKPFEEKRTDAYAKQLEEHLRHWLVDQYAERAGKAWHCDYSSLDAFQRSVEPNREHWRDVLRPPVLTKTGPLTRRPHAPLAELNAEWIVLPLGDLTAEAILVVPANASPEKPVPLVIAQHGIGSFPENTFGLYSEAYHSYARELVKSGFAVLAPLNLRSIDRRNRIERLCRLAQTSLPGIELARVQNLLDVVLADPRINHDRVGMWGVSLGGMATMFYMPLEPRIKAGVVSGWFNHRLSKMVIPDERYSCFLETKEEHAFFDGWLTEFADHDAIKLICPRPMLIQHGKGDHIANWPDLVEEFNTAHSHYEKLGVGDRMELNLHEGKHEAITDTGIKFLTHWLKEK